MNNLKVSVVIPVYRVEDYIEKCIRSLMDQTLKDVEYIFIDDCTEDKSINILKSIVAEYPDRKDNVIIVHNQANIGQAKSRRRGIMMARGEYVIHCDSDDWVDIHWLERLYESAKKVGADMAGCGFTSVTADGEFKCNQKTKVDSIEDLLIKLELGLRMGSLCLHLVKRDIVQSDRIIWPEWNYCEDLFLMLQYVLVSQVYCDVNESLYKYRENQRSITAKRDSVGVVKNIEGEISAALSSIRIYRNRSLKKIHTANLLARIYKAKGRVLMISNNSTEFCNLWHMIKDGLTFMDIWRSSLNVKEKFTTTLIFLKVYPYVRRWKKT